MAEALFNKLSAKLKLDAVAESAGITAIPNLPISEYAANALKLAGITDFFHLSQQFSGRHIESFDLFIGMTSTHNYILEKAGVSADKIYSFSTEIPDPYLHSQDEYVKCCTLLSEQLLLLTEKIRNADRHKSL
jgi:protein-tyrosine-phosphatase